MNLLEETLKALKRNGKDPSTDIDYVIYDKAIRRCSWDIFAATALAIDYKPIYGVDDSLLVVGKPIENNPTCDIWWLERVWKENKQLWEYKEGVLDIDPLPPVSLYSPTFSQLVT